MVNMTQQLQQYLAQIEEQLPRDAAFRARILDELEGHLLESWEYEVERGVPMDEALNIVLERFGHPSLIGLEFALLEREHQLWRGKQYWQRAFLFLAPILCCYVIAGLAMLGFDAPRQALIHFSNDVGNGLAVIHAWFAGILILGWLMLGGPLACLISSVQGIVVVKKWTWVTCLNLLFATLGLALLLLETYAICTG
jgi:hypothetical protein